MENVCETLSLDEMLEALADTQRRTLLVALLEKNPRDLSPPASDDSESGADAVERLVTMRHLHLPKLADYGFIRWDEESHEVTKGPNFEEIRPLLELLREHEDELPDDWP